MTGEDVQVPRDVATDTRPWRTCHAEPDLGCGLELPCGSPLSAAFWGPDTGCGLCRLCQANCAGDKVVGVVPVSGGDSMTVGSGSA